MGQTGILTADYCAGLEQFSNVISSFGSSFEDTSNFIITIGNTGSALGYSPNYDYYTTTTTTYPISSPKIRSICHCDYCGTAYDDETEFVSNCKNCGAIIRR